MARRAHVDEARAAALDGAKELVHAGGIDRMVILDDVFGRVHAIVWPSKDATAGALKALIDARLRPDCEPFWGEVLIVDAAATREDQAIWESAWEEAASIEPMLRLNDRHRNRTGWFLPVEQRSNTSAVPPAVVVFHSFKGGVGRTTALAAYALARARRGELVAVVDVDLDAPGVGLLLDADGRGATARWGTVDFMLEAHENLPLEDYFHRCTREPLTGGGVIEVFPAGRLDDEYVSKLSRVDFEVTGTVAEHPLARLLRRIADERKPTLVLLDGRAGLSPAAGLLLGGLAHLHVLFGTTNPQSLAGLERVVRHLGFGQARRGRAQGECIVVQAMVADNAEIALSSTASYAEQVERMFRAGYYAEHADEEDLVWSLADLESRVAPHRAVPIAYRERLASFRTIDDVVDVLTSEPGYAQLTERLDERLGFSAGVSEES